MNSLQGMANVIVNAREPWLVIREHGEPAADRDREEEIGKVGSGKDTRAGRDLR